MRRRWVGAAVLLPVLLLGSLPSCASPARRPALPPSNVEVPQERKLVWADDSPYMQAVLKFWTERELGDWKEQGKVNEPRILLARLRAGKQLPETHDYLLSLRPWGKSGSSWPLHPQGDYDFTLTVLTSILWLFGEDEARLSPAVREHLLHTLLTEEGNAFRKTVPLSRGLVRETENHLLMTEGSRYLKNRWLHLHGDTRPLTDNATNGMEAKLLGLLDELKTAGLDEFNSQPYIGYTITALLNLEAFGSDAIRSSARELLDQLNWHYALGSYRLRHFAPFRRRYEYANSTALNAGYQTAFMKAWLSFLHEKAMPQEVSKPEATHSLMGLCLPYRPPDEIVRLVRKKDRGYFARIGHGSRSSPEIYSSGENFLLSAGGVNRGEGSHIVARPITLLLDDATTDLSGVFHLADSGVDFREWNNTGVFRNFACAAGSVHIPEKFSPQEENGAWKLYAPAPGVHLVTYSSPGVGLLYVLDDDPEEGVLEKFIHANPDAATLSHSFQVPGGTKLEYDLHSPKDRWVMSTAGGKPLSREFDKWPILHLEQ